MNDILKRIGDFGIVPVVKIDDIKSAIPLGEALTAGGLPIAEITFRTACAEEAIQSMTKTLPQMLIGAGTVLSVDQVKKAVDAGAGFIVSPGFNPKVVGYCVENDIPITPGCSNPTDIEMALEFGLDTVKFFPAETSGGIAALKAMSAPYGMIKFIPTGGINEKNLGSYLSFNKVLACGGSWMVDQALIASNNFEQITKLTKEAVAIMLGFEIGHVGINMPDQESSLGLAERLSDIFGMAMKKGNSSNFAGSCIEVNNSIGLGEHGHIAIKTNNIYRAIAYLEANGTVVDMATAKGPDKAMVAVYLKGSFGGFAIHLLQK
jgi:2-dehydro-3-deoxyphosphogluconate aldolase / (4S)-4-hydroxy-2-oxoglutarate aldolase